MAGSAFAFGSCYGGLCGDQGGDMEIWNNAIVSNFVNTQASTGYVTVGEQTKPSCRFTKPAMTMGSTVFTGDALAYSEVKNQVNYSLVSDCNCLKGDLKLFNNAAVSNFVNTQASTGYVGLKNGWVTTGDGVATSVVQSLVNTNMFGVDLAGE